MIKEEYRDTSPDDFAEIYRLNARIRELEAELEKYQTEEKSNEVDNIFNELFEEMRGFARENELVLICGINEKKQVYEVRFWDRDQQLGYRREFTEDELTGCELSTAMLANAIIKEVRNMLNIKEEK